MYSFYISIKAFHIVLAMLSVSIFTIRGMLMLLDKSIYRSRWFRLSTPLIDTILLIFGLALVFTLGEAVYASAWFWEKMFLLVAYITFGIMALNRLTQKVHKGSAFFLALVSATGMFHAALTKQSIIMLLIP